MRKKIGPGEEQRRKCEGLSQGRGCSAEQAAVFASAAVARLLKTCGVLVFVRSFV